MYNLGSLDNTKTSAETRASELQPCASCEKEWDLRREDDRTSPRLRSRFCRSLPRTDEASAISFDSSGEPRRQSRLTAAPCVVRVRTGSSASKAATLIEEADEVSFWLELLVRVELVKRSEIAGLLGEANELLAIFDGLEKDRRLSGSHKSAEERQSRGSSQLANSEFLVLSSYISTRLSPRPSPPVRRGCGWRGARRRRCRLRG